MIRGIGIDSVTVSEMHKIINRVSTGSLQRIFSKQEMSGATADTAQYLATRFAVKEAVFKAVAHLTVDKSFDLRFVETLNASDGCPYIKINDYMKELMKETKTDHFHVSITTEKDTVTAFVIAEGI